MTAPRIFGAEMTRIPLAHTVTYGLEVKLAECFICQVGRVSWFASVAGKVGGPHKYVGHHESAQDAALAIERELRARDVTAAEQSK